MTLTSKKRKQQPVPPMGRRQLLGIFSATGAMLVTGCGDDSDTATDGATTSTGASEPSTGASTTSTGEPTTGASTTSTGESTTGALECGEPAPVWATGGTAAMTAQDCYPDPFAGGVPGCALLCETTAGPCTTASTPERRDVSEGASGLPVRLALRVVDADTCAPVPGASVEIWHTLPNGVYSGVTPNPPMCNGGDADAAASMAFRGLQTAGPDGRVDFDTCFPGWYSGRAIHIHIRVIRDGQLYATSQLFFTDTLNSEVFAAHPEYSGYGPPNTTNTSDNLFGAQADKARYILDTARMPDGVMLASKVIAIRGALQHPSCKL